MVLSWPKMSRSEVKLHNLLVQCGAQAELPQSWLPSIQKALSDHTHLDCTLIFDHVSIEENPQILGSLLTFTCPPRSGLLGLEGDTRIWQTCAYQAIEAKAPQDLDPTLSDLEKGIMMHVFSRALEMTRQSFQLSGFSQTLKGPLLAIVLNWKVGMWESFLKLWVPFEFLSPKLQQDAREIAKKRCWSVEFPMRVELARVELTQEEMGSLEAGDRLVLEGASWLSAQGFVGEPSFKTLQGSIHTNQETGCCSFLIREIV